MELLDAKIIACTKVWPTLGVGRDKGRRDLKKLEAEGLVSPKRTPTGRSDLSYRDLFALASFYGIETPTLD